MAVISGIRINTLRSCFVNLGYSLELNKAAQQSVVNPIANLKKRTQDTALASKLAQVSSCDRRIGRKDSMEGLADGLVLDSKIGIPNWTLRLQLSTSMSTQNNSPILGGSQCVCRPPRISNGVLGNLPTICASICPQPSAARCRPVPP